MNDESNTTGVLGIAGIAIGIPVLIAILTTLCLLSFLMLMGMGS